MIQLAFREDLRKKGVIQYMGGKVEFMVRGLLDGVERTQKEVADAIGISQSYISRLEKRIIRQLREQLGE